MSAEPQRSSNELAQDRTDLAVLRTVMAAGRTLMAWLRTALSMTGFGFTIYKVLDALQDKIGPFSNVNRPRNVGLFLIALGTVAMLSGLIEYYATIRRLQTLETISLWHAVYIISLIMFFFGLALFIGVAAALL